MAEDDDAEMDTKVMDSDSSEESDENTEELLQKIQELKWKVCFLSNLRPCDVV